MNRPTDDQLKKMVWHILFEIQEFRSACDSWLDVKAFLFDDRANWNRTLASTLLHFRVLREFFLRDPSHDDDVNAILFVREDAWRKARKKVRRVIQVLSENFIKDVHKHLAHLSTGRIKDNGVRWPIGEMRLAVEELIAAFKVSLAPSKSDWFSKLESCAPSINITADSSPGIHTEIRFGEPFGK